MSARPRIAVFASGGGRSLENLATLSESGELDVEVALVVSDRREARVLERAARHGIPTLALPWSECDGARDFSERAFAAADEAGCALVVLAGFLRLVVLPERWAGRVLNIHPSLLPRFGGKGFWGDRVHRAVLEAGVPETGCTVHYVDASYDTGPPLLQRRVPVEPGDDVDTLATRVFAEECVALPEAIRTHFRDFENPGMDPGGAA